MTPLPGLRPLKSVLCALLIAAAATTASATRLRLDRATLEFDPNQPVWHVSTHLCDTDKDPSGTVTYNLWLYQDDASARGGKSHFIFLGGAQFKKVLQPGECWDFTDTRVNVKTAKVTPGQYHMRLVVSEYDGSKYVPRISQPFYLEDGTFQDLRKN